MCHHWIDFLCEADCTDDEVMAALLHSIPSLRHWVAAMGIMEEMELVCRALKALYMWLVRRHAKLQMEFVTHLFNSRTRRQLLI